MNKNELIKYLDEYLQISDFQDNSKNGLQVDNDKKEIKKIGYAVDANSYIFDKGTEQNVDLIIVHHGLFWGNEQVLTGNSYERIKKLIKNDIGLYACHLPLDAHHEAGNNIGITNSIISNFDIGEYKIEKFGDYHGQNIGYGIKFEKKLDLNFLVNNICNINGFKNEFYNFGNKESIKNICVVSGGGADASLEAKNKGYDLFITGEAVHCQLCVGKELKQSILIGGHYETEIIGVSLLAEHLKTKFNLDLVFLDEKY